MNFEPETRDLDVALTDTEVAQKSEALARITAEICEVEEEKAKATRGFSVQLRDLKRRQNELARSVTKREEMRPVLCYPRPDIRRFTIEIYRGDNGKVIDSRAMTKDELEDARQQHLPGVEAVPAGTKARVADALPLATPESSTWTPPDVSDLKAKPGEKLSDVAAKANETSPDETNATTITNPEDLLNGKQAKRAAKAEAAASKPKRQKRKSGLNTGAPGEEMPPATPTTTVGAAAIVNPDLCPSMIQVGSEKLRCEKPEGHPKELGHECQGVVWEDGVAEEIKTESGEPEPDVDERDTDPVGDGDG